MDLFTPRAVARMANRRNVLLAGAGGGFDAYAALPLAVALHDAGVRVHFANLSFTDPSALAALERDGLVPVVPDSPGPATYFPERSLARALVPTGMSPVVHALPRAGVVPLRAQYALLAERLALDAIVLVDGGTDILLRGDEERLGTPEEDLASLAAVAGLDHALERQVFCLGFGIDSFHGVNHVHVLENIADLDAAGAYLGAFSIPGDAPGALLYRDAVAAAARETRRPSLVNGQIAAALAGAHGDVAVPGRARVGELFVNPLMAMYFTVDLVGLARRHRCLERLEGTETLEDVARRIGESRVGVELRQPRVFPH